MNSEIGSCTTGISKILTFMYASLLAFVAVTLGIAVPILWRGFYYLHIDFLQLTKVTLWSEEQIKTAFNEMMNFIWRDAPFGTGDLKWSQAGMEHFADCKKLFWLDINVLVVSVAGLLILCFIASRMRLKPCRVLGFGTTFWAGVSVFVLFGIVFALGAIDFDKAFVVFHRLFFPGKTNWIFDPMEDEIIMILPEKYFMDCAILAIAIMVAICIVYMILGRRRIQMSKDVSNLHQNKEN